MHIYLGEIMKDESKVIAGLIPTKTNEYILQMEERARMEEELAKQNGRRKR